MTPPPSQAIYRILDANLDRAREGLRIVEEWCRFGLNNAHLTQDCKAMRQELAQWHSLELRAARNTPDDPGTAFTHPHEETRTDIQDLLHANLSRVQEALRVLEEYAKLYQGEMSAACKQIRYRVYTLESQLAGDNGLTQRLKAASLYLVTAPSQHLFATVEAALQGGLTLVQYREKNADDQVRLAQAQKLRDLCHQYGALFLINDRIDLALAVGADGVHLGQQDAPIAVARALLGSDRIIGRSTHDPGEMEQAIAEGADYIGVGPVYETPTKPGRTAVGLDYVRYAAQHCPIPWYAIGSIDLETLGDVMQAGGRRVAVVRALMQAEDPTLTTRQFLIDLQRMG